MPTLISCLPCERRRGINVFDLYAGDTNEENLWAEMIWQNGGELDNCLWEYDQVKRRVLAVRADFTGKN